jgi:hypothetical protein
MDAHRNLLHTGNFQHNYDTSKYHSNEYESNKQVQYVQQLDLNRAQQLAGLKKPTGQLFYDVNYPSQQHYAEVPTKCVDGYVSHSIVQNPQFGHNSDTQLWDHYAHYDQRLGKEVRSQMVMDGDKWTHGGFIRDRDHMNKH